MYSLDEVDLLPFQPARLEMLRVLAQPAYSVPAGYVERVVLAVVAASSSAAELGVVVRASRSWLAGPASAAAVATFWETVAAKPFVPEGPFGSWTV